MQKGQRQKARGKRQETKAKGKRQRDKCKRQETNARGKRHMHEVDAGGGCRGCTGGPPRLVASSLLAGPKFVGK